MVFKSVALFVLFIIWSYICIIKTNAEEKKEILFMPRGLTTFRLKQISEETGNESIQSYDIPANAYKQINVTLEEFKKSIVMLRRSGREDIILPNGESFPIDLAVEEEIQFMNQDGSFSFSMSKGGFLARNMEDIKNDTGLIPLEYPSINWTLPSTCNLSSIAVESFTLSFRIYINGNQVSYQKISHKDMVNHIWWSGQGISMSVINPSICKFTYHNIFPTSDYGAHRDLSWMLESIKPGRLVILISLRDGSLRLEDARNKMTIYGSFWSKYYFFKDKLVNIFTAGGVSHLEAFIPNFKTLNDSSSPARVDIAIESPSPLEAEVCHSWPKTPEFEARNNFCLLNDGYGELCDCDEPFQIRYRQKKEKNNTIKIAIVVIAGNRTRHLFMMLKSIGKQPGVFTDSFLLVVDGQPKTTLQLGYILNLAVIIHRPEGLGSSKITTNLRFGMYNALQKFENADFFIILEDDLLLSPDFYSYMVQLSPLFELDKSIFCVSAFNHLAYPHTSMDPQRLYRVDSFPAYGWMMSRKLLIEILPKFLPKKIDQDWDYFMGSALVRRGREIIIPDVNRAKHWATKGFHVKESYYSERLYLIRDINHIPNITLMDITRLKKKAYEKEMEELFAKATHFVVTDPENITLPESKHNIYVSYVRQNNESDDMTFRVIGEGFQIWNIDSRDSHYNCWRFYYKNATILIVGYPLSRYSIYRRKKESVLEATAEGLLSLNLEQSIAHMRVPILTHDNYFYMPTVDGENFVSVQKHNSSQKYLPKLK